MNRKALELSLCLRKVDLWEPMDWRFLEDVLDGSHQGLSKDDSVGS